MANPRLTNEQREKLFKPLFDLVKTELEHLSAGDANLLWALRRKLTKELGYLERNTPTHRNKLKALMWQKQNGRCALCNKDMPQKNSELDRFEAVLGYTESNVRLVCHDCHVRDQADKKYTDHENKPV
jgi:hypothetical protein